MVKIKYDMKNDILWTKNYLAICIASFLSSFSFYILVPTLPFFLKEEFDISHSLIGVILSCYVVSILCIRPFAGFISDSFPRKKIYILAYILFAMAFAGYIFFRQSLLIFILIRIFHGFAFGLLTTSVNTLVIDIMPSSKRGEGLGYFGVMNNLAMAIGPMTGLFIISKMSFNNLFTCSLLSASLGILISLFIRAPKNAQVFEKKRIISLDKFFLLKGTIASASLFLLAIPYGMTTSYIAVYAKNIGLEKNAGLFFTIMAFGLILSRLKSGKQVDKGLITPTISKGIFIIIFAVLGEAILASVAKYSIGIAYTIYFISAIILGFGFGTMFPAFNTLFINLAPNYQRATANSTYLTGWDAGIGCGMLFGGVISDIGFNVCYSFGLILVVTAFIFFNKVVSPHFERNRLR